MKVDSMESRLNLAFNFFFFVKLEVEFDEV